MATVALLMNFTLNNSKTVSLNLINIVIRVVFVSCCSIFTFNQFESTVYEVVYQFLVKIFQIIVNVFFRNLFYQNKKKKTMLLFRIYIKNSRVCVYLNQPRSSLLSYYFYNFCIKRGSNCLVSEHTFYYFNQI